MISLKNIEKVYRTSSIETLALTNINLQRLAAMAARYPYETASVNHTFYTPLLIRPVSVSIETKQTGEGWHMAMLQSGVWVAAQFAKLERLVIDIGGGGVGAIPFLPLVVVQGHDWFFLAASRGVLGQTVSLLSQPPDFSLRCFDAWDGC